LFIQDPEHLAQNERTKRSYDEINQIASLSALDSNQYLKNLKNFRVLKNLGTKINSVYPFLNKHMSGFTVEYIDGDTCLADKLQKYRSKVKYLCNPDGDEQLVDYPLLEVPPTAGYYQGVNQCQFDFIWESRFACPPCQHHQVDLHEGFCQEDGTRLVTVTKKEQ